MESGTVEATAESPSMNVTAPPVAPSNPEPVTQSSPTTPNLPVATSEQSSPPTSPASSDVPSVPSSEAPAKVIETRLVPVELHNINLLVELRVPVAAAQSFEETQSLIQRLREKFGQDSLIEELSQVLNGTIEKVSISRPVEAQQTVAISQPQQVAPVQMAPVQVQIPQTQQDYGNYLVQSTSTPWHGQQLRNLDPASIYKVLYDPAGAALRPLLTPQDITMMDCYYRAWHDSQVKKN